MNKKILSKEEIKTLRFINDLQDKVNELYKYEYNHTKSFDNTIKKYFTKKVANLNDCQKIKLRSILFNLEELNLIEGDVLFSPRITEEGKDVLRYYKLHNYIVCNIISITAILTFIFGIEKIIKNNE